MSPLHVYGSSLKQDCKFLEILALIFTTANISINKHTVQIYCAVETVHGSYSRDMHSR